MRRSSCATAASRLRRQGRHPSGRQRQRRNRGRDPRTRRPRSASARRDADRARRHRDKSRLGANAVLGVSMAAARAAAAAAGVPLWRYLGGDQAQLLPVPAMNVLNGGVHADNPIDFQEFMIAPVGRELVRRRASDRRRGLPPAQGTLKQRGLAGGVGDEGGFAPMSGVQRGAARADRHRDRSGRLPPRRRRRDLPRPRRERVLSSMAATSWRARIGRCRARR